jgi:hypothetical protein
MQNDVAELMPVLPPLGGPYNHVRNSKPARKDGHGNFSTDYRVRHPAAEYVLVNRASCLSQARAVFARYRCGFDKLQKMVPHPVIREAVIVAQ